MPLSTPSPVAENSVKSSSDNKDGRSFSKINFQIQLTDIIVGLAGKKFESIRRRVKLLEENCVLLLLCRLVAADEALALGRVAVSKNSVTKTPVCVCRA